MTEQTQEEQRPRAGDQNPDGSVVVLSEGVEVEAAEEAAQPDAGRVGPGGHYKDYKTQTGDDLQVLVLPSPGSVEGEEGGGTTEAQGPATDPDLAAAGSDDSGTPGPAETQAGFAPGDAPA